MLGRGARFELGVEQRSWGFGCNTETRSLVRSHSQPAQPHGEADKEEQHTARGQHTPGGWGIIPQHHAGGAGGGRSIRVRGLCLSRVVCKHTYVSLLAIEAFLPTSIHLCS